MRQKRYLEEQIIKILSEQTAGVMATEVIRKYGVSEQLYCRWNAKYVAAEHSGRIFLNLEDVA